MGMTSNNSGESSCRSCTLSDERKGATGSAVTAVDTNAAFCPTKRDQLNDSGLVNSAVVVAVKKGTPLPNAGQLIVQHTSQRNKSYAGNQRPAAVVTSGEDDFLPGYMVGSSGQPSVFAPSEILTDIPSYERHGGSTFNGYERTGDDLACWWAHRSVREIWRVFVAALGLLVMGTALIVMGIAVCLLPEIEFQSYVFFIAGFFCFIPGAYYVVYVYCAVKGRKGYDFYQLPLFN